MKQVEWWEWGPGPAWWAALGYFWVLLSSLVLTTVFNWWLFWAMEQTIRLVTAR